jgi:hypothetical protein
MSSEQVRFERMIRSVSELPKASPGFRKRVLRSAKRAEKDRSHRRIRWTLCLCAAACLFVLGMYSYPPQKHRSFPAGAQSSQNLLEQKPKAAAEADWHDVEEFERKREIPSGFIRGSF